MQRRSNPVLEYLRNKQEYKEAALAIISIQIDSLDAKRLKLCYGQASQSYIENPFAKNVLTFGFSYLNRYRKVLEKFPEASNNGTYDLPKDLSNENAKDYLLKLLTAEGGTDLKSFKYHLVKEILFNKSDELNRPNYVVELDNDLQAGSLIKEVLEKLGHKPVEQISPRPFNAGL